MGVAEYIGTEIRVMRKSRKMTQADLAKAIGQSPSSITMYETGRREPNFETLEALADVFNVPLSALIGYEPESVEPGHYYLREMLEQHELELQEFSEIFMTRTPAKQKMIMKILRSIVDGEDE